ncbi:Crp/Fnr family transcriptional regulator [Heliorestis acidaminivorans]|uniref:Crp/Fnr family transcriptional regulator n=2 Tax=Heliorestis acidaminivorans TaxID=553427 RepID=A0A6I0F1P1_9FIRM|nr:Crp/Fnr family transcriptional regulator [Heliorestis acidaminivorans]
MHSLPLFEQLPEEILTKYLKQWNRQKVSKKEVLFSPDNENDLIYLILQGRLRVYLSYPNGKEFTLTILEQGDIYSGHTRAFGLALEDTEVALIPRKAFRKLLMEVPAFSLVLLSVLGDSLKNAFNIIEDLAFRDVQTRLLKFLINEGERKGVQTLEGIEVSFDLTHEEIASLIGTTRQTVSLLFNSLQKEGLLHHGKGKVLIKDLEQLKHLTTKIE